MITSSARPKKRRAPRSGKVVHELRHALAQHWPTTAGGINIAPSATSALLPSPLLQAALNHHLVWGKPLLTEQPERAPSLTRAAPFAQSHLIHWAQSRAEAGTTSKRP